jgi:hypothetical protein
MGLKYSNVVDLLNQYGALYWPALVDVVMK